VYQILVSDLEVLPRKCAQSKPVNSIVLGSYDVIMTLLHLLIFSENQIIVIVKLDN